MKIHITALLLSFVCTQQKVCYYQSKSLYGTSTLGTPANDLPLLYNGPLFPNSHRITKIKYCSNPSTTSNNELVGLQVTVGIIGGPASSDIALN